MAAPPRTKSRTRKILRWMAARGLGSVIRTSLMSGSGLAVVGTMVAWVGTVNLSSSTQDLTVRLTTFLSANGSPVVYLAGILVATGLSYRFPKTIMFLASLVLATFYLTPLSATARIVGSYRLILTLTSIGFFTLAAAFYSLKRKHQHRLMSEVRTQ